MNTNFFVILLNKMMMLPMKQMPMLKLLLPLLKVIIRNILVLVPNRDVSDTSAIHVWAIQRTASLKCKLHPKKKQIKQFSTHNKKVKKQTRAPAGSFLVRRCFSRYFALSSSNACCA